MSSNPSQTEEQQQQQKPSVSPPASTPPPSASPQKSPSSPAPRQATAPATTTAASPVATQKEPEGPLLFHFADCTNCHNLLPLSTTTEKYFPILSKEPKKAVGLGEKCARCGADSWVLVTG